MWAAPYFFRIRSAAAAREERSPPPSPPGDDDVPTDEVDPDYLPEDHPRRRFWAAMKNAKLPSYMESLALQPPDPTRKVNLPPMEERRILRPEEVKLLGGAFDWTQMFLHPPSDAVAAERAEAEDARRRGREIRQPQNPIRDPWQVKFKSLEKLPQPGEVEPPDEEDKPVGISDRLLGEIGCCYASGVALGFFGGSIVGLNSVAPEVRGFRLRVSTFLNHFEQMGGAYGIRFGIWGLWYTLSTSLLGTFMPYGNGKTEMMGVAFSTALMTWKEGKVVALVAAGLTTFVSQLFIFNRDNFRKTAGRIPEFEGREWRLL